MNSGAIKLKTAFRERLSLIRIQPFDTSTEQGRSQERMRRVALTSLAAMLARFISLGSVLVTIPLTLHYLGTERYGLWMTMSSLIGFISFADFGMGVGLQNVISQSHGTNDRQIARQYVSSGLLMLICTSAFGFLLFALIYHWIPWHSLFSVRSPLAIREAGPAVFVLVLCCLANILVGVVRAAQVGYQEGMRNNLWQSFGSVLGVIALLAVIHSHLGLPWLVFALAGAPVAATLLNGAVFFLGDYRWLMPRWSDANLQAALRLFRLGLGFLLLQVTFILGYSTDTLVIAHLLGASAVTSYSIVIKLFGLGTMVITMYTASIWPAYTEAFARGDTDWLKKTLWRSVRSSFLLMASLSLLFVVFGQAIVYAYTGHHIRPSEALIISLAVWTTLDSIRITISTFLNAMNVTTFQSVAYGVFAVVAVGARYYFGIHYGIAGIVWGAVAALALCVLLPYTKYIQRWR